jgi:polysaccharide export outer membrane protein
LLGAFALGGCALLPATGPAAEVVRADYVDPESVPHAFVKINARTVAVLADAAPRLTQFAVQRRPRDIRFGVGDTLGVTIFEASSGGLFIPSEAGVRPGNFIQIPPQSVDANGNISVPYAGNIRAQGRTKEEVQQAIVDALKNRAIEPQVVVTTIEQRTSLVTVLGDVGRSGRIPAAQSAERILDIIARSGGTAGPGSEMWVTLERNGKRATAPFGALIYEPRNNVYIHADDTIYVYREPQTYLAFGAIGRQTQIPFGAWRLSLAEAVGRAGGLIDQLSDPASVFLYRGETCEVARKLEIDCALYPGPLVPVIYNLNLREGSGYFLATKFEMRNKDVIYVSNATSVEVQKFVSFLRTLNSAVQDPVNTSTQIINLKNLIQGTGTNTIVTTPTPIGPAP